MSDVENAHGDASVEDPMLSREPAQPIESRFLFVDVAALRAKQLRRGALPRLRSDGETHSELPAKAERIAMEEVRKGFVGYDLPEFKAPRPTSES